ncbi:MAG TPA: hypothetical protein PK992_10245, partial [Planctomycetaceae bacterium]|nr:hypothetical protein [Planctomycetaceae bacterium]
MIQSILKRVDAGTGGLSPTCNPARNQMAQHGNIGRDGTSLRREDVLFVLYSTRPGMRLSILVPGLQ